ncbi:MAG: hypothetical protein EBX52_02800 [Proteobacteria bacterium]|nr:hypothetical protein [Pseudomonadota bacterium]
MRKDIIGFLLLIPITCAFSAEEGDCSRLATRFERFIGQKLEVNLWPLGEVLADWDSSILFYKGEIPGGGHFYSKDLFSIFPIQFIKNEKTGVVLIYSKDGQGHDVLKTLVPAGGEILGGVRFKYKSDGTGELLYMKNSSHFWMHEGESVLEQNFVLHHRR